MKVLIFGGAGFVGRHYTNYFLNKGDNVTIVDNLAKLTGCEHPRSWKICNPYKYNHIHHHLQYSLIQ